MKNDNRCYAIDVFRLLCAVMVVAIHTYPFEDQNELLGFATTRILPRFAVPFFFIVTGYFYLQRVEKGEKMFKSSFVKMISIYVFWSMIYIFRNFVVLLCDKTFSISAFKEFLKNTVLKFFIFGSEYHLWYIIGLIISMAFVSILYSLNLNKSMSGLAIILYILGLLGESYYAIGNKIFVISQLVNYSQYTTIRRVFFMGIPFFCAGRLVKKITDTKQAGAIKRGLLLFGIAFLVEICIVVYFDLQRSIILTAFLYPFVIYFTAFLFVTKVEIKKKMAAKCKSLSNYIYFSHPLFLWLIGTICDYNNLNMLNIMKFISVICICVLTWKLLYRSNNKIIRKYVVSA